MKKETYYKEVRIYVADNGYTLAFSQHQGKYGDAFKVTKDLNEIRQILKQELLPLIDKTND